MHPLVDRCDISLRASLYISSRTLHISHDSAIRFVHCSSSHTELMHMSAKGFADLFMARCMFEHGRDDLHMCSDMHLMICVHEAHDAPHGRSQCTVFVKIVWIAPARGRRASSIHCCSNQGGVSTHLVQWLGNLSGEKEHVQMNTTD